jgi:hypothetical protein
VGEAILKLPHRSPRHFAELAENSRIWRAWIFPRSVYVYLRRTPRARKRDRNVDSLMPSRAAVPSGPETLPSACASARSKVLAFEAAQLLVREDALRRGWAGPASLTRFPEILFGLVSEADAARIKSGLGPLL